MSILKVDTINEKTSGNGVLIPGHVAQVKQGSLNYLWFIAVLSVAIGMINLFPIPVLDGGHLMFFAFEALLGKKPNPAVVNGFMTLGFFIIISLMVFSLFNDVLCP